MDRKKSFLIVLFNSMSALTVVDMMLMKREAQISPFLQFFIIHQHFGMLLISVQMQEQLKVLIFHLQWLNGHHSIHCLVERSNSPTLHLFQLMSRRDLPDHPIAITEQQKEVESFLFVLLQATEMVDLVLYHAVESTRQGDGRSQPSSLLIQYIKLRGHCTQKQQWVSGIRRINLAFEAVLP